MKHLLTLIFALVFTLNTKANTARYRLVITDNPATTITIAWDQVSGENPVVYYGTTDYGTNYASYPNTKSVDRAVDYLDMNNQFAKLTDLMANTDYYFVIKDSEGTSERFWFRTAPSDNSNMAFISGGDSRNNRVPRVHANKLVAKIKPTAVFFGGDMTNGDTGSEWIEWMDDWQNTTASDGRMFPIIPARGNHERSNASIYNLFNTPSTDAYYDITFGENLYTIYTLNSEIAEGGDQYTWLSNNVSSNTSIWKSAQYHKPMRPHVSSKSEGNAEYSNWAQLFYDEGFDLVFESDSHTVKTTYPIKPCDGSPNCDEGFERDDENGTIYTGEGCWGAPLRTSNDAKIWTRDNDTFNQFKYVEVSETAIVMQTIKVDNEESVGENGNNEAVGVLPSGIDIWNPSNGSKVTMYKTNVSENVTFTASEDGEEQTDGSIELSSSDLELVHDGSYVSGDQVIGIQFSNINILSGVTITNAYIEFTPKTSLSGTANFEIALEDTDNSATMSESSNNITGRTYQELISWSPGAWTKDVTDEETRTPNLSAQLQSIIDKSGWSSGNKVLFKLQAASSSQNAGTALRRAYSLEGTTAPKLVVEYESNISRPTVEITSLSDGGYKKIGINTDIDVDASDADGSISNVKFYINSVLEFTDTSAPYSLNYDFNNGEHLIKVVAEDNDGITTESEIQVAFGTYTKTIIISALEDSEEQITGNMRVTDNDLEFVYDNWGHPGDQVIGVQFSNLEIPKASTINNAYVEFTPKTKFTAETANFEVTLEDTDNSATIASTDYNISNRTYMSSVPWSPGVWEEGVVNDDTRTPNLSDMLQTIVNKSGWELNNRVLFKIQAASSSENQGATLRRAHSAQGVTPPKLIVNYTLGEQDYEYCDAAGSAGTGSDWIKRVQFNDIDNSSEKSTYSDFRSISTILRAGETYNMRVDFNNAYNPDDLVVYIDYNYDGDFDESDEKIDFDNSNVAANKFIAGDITIPETATLEKPLRMRVRSVYSQTVSPCGTQFGEVEDYIIYVKENSDLSINETAFDKIDFYPNPINNGEFLHITSASKESLKVEIINYSGIVIHKSIGIKDILISDILPGVYIIRIQQNNKITSKKLLVK